MKVIDMKHDNLTLELSEREIRSIQDALLYVLSEVPERAFSSLCHFRKPTAFHLRKQLCKHVLPHVEQTSQPSKEAMQKILHTYGYALVDRMGFPSNYT